MLGEKFKTEKESEKKEMSPTGRSQCGNVRERFFTLTCDVQTHGGCGEAPKITVRVLTLSLVSGSSQFMFGNLLKRERASEQMSVRNAKTMNVASPQFWQIVQQVLPDGGADGGAKLDRTL